MLVVGAKRKDTDQRAQMSDDDDIDDDDENSAGASRSSSNGERHTERNIRRRSISHKKEKEKRASTKAILADDIITPSERRQSIQSLIDNGRRPSTQTLMNGRNSSNNSITVVAIPVATAVATMSTVEMRKDIVDLL